MLFLVFFGCLVGTFGLYPFEQMGRATGGCRERYHEGQECIDDGRSHRNFRGLVSGPNGRSIR